MSRIKKILIVGVVLVALVAMAGTVMVFAQADKNDGDSGQSGARAPVNQVRPDGRARRNWQDKIDYDALLADVLDITVEELNEARADAKAAALEQAVEEGYITQRQVDLMTAVRTLRGVIDKGELVAEALGISVEELQEAREGQAIRELLAELNMTPAEVRQAVVEGYEEAVDQAVEDGLITDEQAELIRNRPGLIIGNPEAIQRRQLDRGRWSGPAQQGGRGRGPGFRAPFQGGNRPPARSGGV